MQRKHKLQYEQFEKEKKEKKLVDVSSGTGQRLLTTIMSPLHMIAKFSCSDAKQQAISDAITKMIIKDLAPIQIVDCEGFRDLLALIEPRYRMVSRSHIQGKRLPQYKSKVEEAIVAKLQKVESCNVTIDIRSSRRMHSYLGVTCHFLTRSWQLESVLLCCSHLQSRHTGDNILAEFEATVEKYSIVQRVFQVVTDNASNMQKAFPDSVSLPSFDIETDEEDLIDSGDPLDSGEESDEQSGDEIGNFASFDLALGPKRIGCFAHTLQLYVKDGLAQCAILSRVLTKAAKVVNHIRKSTSATVKMETVFG